MDDDAADDDGLAWTLEKKVAVKVKASRENEQWNHINIRGKPMKFFFFLLFSLFIFRKSPNRAPKKSEKYAKPR